MYGRVFESIDINNTSQVAELIAQDSLSLAQAANVLVTGKGLVALERLLHPREAVNDEL